jgi:hypothetical protein
MEAGKKEQIPFEVGNHVFYCTDWTLVKVKGALVILILE